MDATPERAVHDVVVIGAGPGGEVAAGYLAQAGLDVAIVEDRKVGGECSYWACMPSKTLLRPGEVLAEARRVPGAAASVSGELDTAAVLAWRDDVVNHLDDSAQLPWLDERGITLYRGWGRLVGPQRVEVDGRVLEARRAVVLAGGSTPTVPPIDGLAEARPWTNREATTAARLPASLVVLGGGVVGVETSQAYRSLGVDVTLVEGERHLLPREEEFACEQVTAALRDAGVDIRTGARATAVRRTADRVEVTLDDGGSVEADEVLVALGRTPQTTGLGLESVGLADDATLSPGLDGRVGGLPWLYVLGDLDGRAPFTHMAKYRAGLVADAVLGRDTAVRHGADDELAPRVVFSDPQVAAVGHTTRTAARAGLEVRVVDVPTSGNAGGTFHGAGTAGTSRFLVDEARGVLVGVTLTGTEVAEMLHAATIAVVGEVPIARLRHAVPAFPTRSEIWLHLLDALRE
ncbi:NAD(P)/FAD-dependent oxidoreductase [Cellulomonas sp. APG4]|uniref:dihydrolipoyl dehydrogenase family protein n=1 Tax=Cellulomonas sp. APG4 TaxID=1538656 RepID=UPI00137AA4AC|nr:NAD(P)/FAD-dependent oxidoreductase [Cellulomonas sp. APG4]NCT90779.1 NAD(P)/FAD-dependent oxidoreductase [Cellulomonas sp. APG4]